MIYAGSLAVFALVTLSLGGAAALATGRAVARTWAPLWHLAVYIVLLTAAVRFLHFALFQETLSGPLEALSSGAILAGGAALGYRIERMRQMCDHYPWLYERAGFLGWQPRHAAPGP